MSKRINPINFRLGLSQLWKLDANFYGKKFQSYIKLVNQKNKTAENLNLSLASLQIFSNIVKHKIHKKYWKVITRIYCSNLQQGPIKFKHFLLPYESIYYWLEKPCFLNFYNQSSKANSALLLCYWVKFHFNQSKLSLKQILVSLEVKLTSKINKRVVRSNLPGLKPMKVKGIKVCCKGRLGNIRNPLTQVLVKTWGSVSLPKLNSYVEYSQDYILTKRGNYGLQVWIFYS